MYRVLVGSFPFVGMRLAKLGIDKSNLSYLVRKGDFDIPQTLSPEARTLITALLHPTPSKRPAVSEVSES